MENNEKVKKILQDIEDEENSTKVKDVNKKVYQKWWFWIIIIILFIIICSSNNDNNKATNNLSSSNNTAITNKTMSTTVKKNKVTVIDFSQMSKEEVQNWCNENRLIYNIKEEYSDIIEKGAFVSQNNSVNSIIEEGEIVTITYSLGKEPTLGEKNALIQAKKYLNNMSFSYKGLIEQLKYEGYSTEESTYGVDNCGADWNEQAIKKAKSYVSTMTFSRKGLIEQLEYEGFTKEQAEYGATAVGY